MSDPRTVQRSFRLAQETAADLDRTADSGGHTRSSLVERLLREGLRQERHPLITFRTGPAGRREPALAATRLKVRDIVAVWRAHDRDEAATSDYFPIDSALVRAAIDYFAEFQAEIEADLEWSERAERAARERVERRAAVT